MKNLKNYIAVLLLVPAFVACDQKKVDQLTAENQELSTTRQELNQELESYMKTFNEIEANLKEIKEREDKINLKASDNVEYKETDAKTAIVRDIQMINKLMAENRIKMSELQSKLNTNSKELKRMVGNLNNRIKEKDGEITVLKEDLEKLNIEKGQLAQHVENLSHSVDTLSHMNNFQSEVIATQTQKIEQQIETINTGYIAIGTYKDLRNEEVVAKEGGILGIGSTERLRDNFNEKVFSKVDITQVSSIPVYAKKVELITNHPNDSYKISKNEEEGVEQIMITNPSKFWNSSKYLVVMVDN